MADMLYVMKDCQTVIVAAEGEAFTRDGKFVNHPYTPVPRMDFVTNQIILRKNHNNCHNTGCNMFVSTLHIYRYDELKPAGVRFVYTGNNSTFSQDLEPEYIAVDKDTNKAYVVLQENNAIAEVDLTTQTITNIRGLGYKQWGGLDASDRDGGIRITFWPIRAWYQPDSAKFHQWQGRKLLFTANEGDSKEYRSLGFTEEVKGQDIPTSALGPEIHEMVKSALRDESLLGRLEFSANDGKDKTGTYRALYTHGARSFSIWDLTSANDDVSSALPQLFDSGSEFEEMTALHCPHAFNTNSDDPDSRSDNKGSEPESLTLAEINNRLYIFIGNERPGTIHVYSLGRDVSRPRFETVFCGGIPDNSKTTQQNFEDGELYGIDPEDLKFYSADESPTGKPVLMVAGAISGTVTLLEVKVTDDGSDDSPSTLMVRL
ncbi:mesenchyme-specific cell surface glycoprotein [Elysia marginata]|uniref:Mesenchyme-specific cell surface glycoprotein n=1 Tax=Elysia marginata TaxID=1093978 RepID=A0AAV4FQQ8_9GAST|nr:mesenchyme-specific cell surface glycoprotein [Elysia marginata]